MAFTTQIIHSLCIQHKTPPPIGLGRVLVILTGLLCLCGPALSESYGYDLAGRLVKVTYDDGSTIDYAYDPAGNITSVRNGVLVLPPDGEIDTPDMPVTITAGESVDFMGTGFDPGNLLPLSYLWEFDGAAEDSIDEDPGLVTFSDAGIYTVRFTVTNAFGLADPTPATQVITVDAASGGGGGGGSGNSGGGSRSGSGSVDFWFLALLALSALLRSPLKYQAARIGSVLLLGLLASMGSAAEWRALDSGTQLDLTGVWGSAPDNVFAVGPAGTILHFDGDRWTSMSSCTLVDLNGIYGYAGDDVYAVGNGATILRYDGSSWSPFTGPNDENGNPETGNFVDVWTAGPGGNLWVITTRRAYYYDGSAWLPQSFSDQFSATFTPQSELRAIGGGGANVIVAGRPLNADGAGLYANFRETLPLQNLVGTGVFGISANDIFYTGNSSLRFQGTNPRTTSDWTQISIMSDPEDIWGASSDAVFAVGRQFSGIRGYIASYDGNATNTWVQSLDTGDVGMTAVWGFSATDVFAVGERGAIYRYGEGPGKLTSDNYPQSGWLTETVNAYTGELVLESVDMDFGGKIPVLFSRYYASGLKDTLPSNGRLGRNWSHTYEWRLTATADRVTIHSPRGRRLDFSRIAAEWQLDTDIGIRYQLLGSVATGTFTLLDESTELMYSFDATLGRLLNIRDRIGNSLSVGYIANFAPPVSVTDGKGRTIFFGYDADQQLVSVTGGAGVAERTFQYEYQDGNLTTVRAPGSAVTRYVYDADIQAARITSVELPSGTVPYAWTFGSDGRVDSEAEAAGSTFTITYESGTTPARAQTPDGSGAGLRHDANGRLAARIDEDGFTQRATYTASGRVASITDRFDVSTTVEYDPQTDKPTVLHMPDGLSTSFRYMPNTSNGFTFSDLVGIDYPDLTSRTLDRSSNGLVTAEVDRASNRWEYMYDAAGNLTSQQLPTAGSYVMSYHTDDTLASVQDPAGNVTEFGYDGAKRLAVIRYPGPDNVTRLFSYDLNDRLTTLTDEAGSVTTIAYTADGQPESVDLPEMPPIGRGYDAFGRPNRITTPKGDAFIARYDGRGRAYQFENPLGETSTFSYNNVNRPVGLRMGTRPEWRRTSDREGVPTEVTLPDPAQAVIRYHQDNDPLGRIARVEQGGVGIGIARDPNGRVTAITNEHGESFVQEFDGPGKTLSRQSVAGGTVASGFEYNRLGQVTAIRDGNANRWSRNYDPGGRPSQFVDPLGRATVFGYDERNRLNRVDFPDPLGRVDMVKHVLGGDAERNYSDGESLRFGYDALGRLKTANGITLDYDDNGNIAMSNDIVMQYDAADRLETVELAPGKLVTYAYDDRDMLIGVRDWLGDALIFERDDIGRVIDIRRSNGANTSLAYDTRGRLAGIVVPGKSSINLTRRADGLIESAQRSVPRPTGLTDISSRTFNHDTASQIDQFSYDAMGRRLSDDRHAYSWSVSGRLKQISSDSAPVAFEYDALGARTGRSQGGASIEYVWNYGLELPSISIQRESGADKRYFVHSPAGDLLYSVETNGSRRFYHYDENGNTLYITSDTGDVLASYAYSPYGELLSSAGSIENDFTYVGQRGVMREGDSGLYYMRARYYDAVSARFLSRDPQQGSTPRRVNPYQYAQGNPLTFRDPIGHGNDGGLVDWITDQWSETRDAGFGVLSLLGQRWETAFKYVMDESNKLGNRNKLVSGSNAKADARRALGQGRGTHLGHRALQAEASAAATRAGATSTFTQSARIIGRGLLISLSGFIAMHVEKTDAYASTSAGRYTGKVGVFATNTLASGATPASATFMVLSTGVDITLEWAGYERLGAHEFINAPARTLAAVAEDMYRDGSIFGPRSSTRRLVHSFKTEYGQASATVAAAGEAIGDSPLGAALLPPEVADTDRHLGPLTGIVYRSLNFAEALYAWWNED